MTAPLVTVTLPADALDATIREVITARTRERDAGHGLLGDGHRELAQGHLDEARRLDCAAQALTRAKGEAKRDPEPAGSVITRDLQARGMCGQLLHAPETFVCVRDDGHDGEHACYPDRVNDKLVEAVERERALAHPGGDL